MANTTSFQDWISNNEPETFEEGYSLHMACNGSDCGIYGVARDGDKLFIKGPDGDTLMLASGKAASAFEKLVDTYNPHPEMGWEAAAAFHHAMERDD